MSQYDDFTGNSSFYYDNGNNIYELNDTHYIVNDVHKRNELKDLEGYRYFLYGGNKPVTLFMSFFLIAFPLTILLKTVWFPNLDENITPFLIAFPIHLLIRNFYSKKIEKILDGCPVLPKDEDYKHSKKDKNNGEELPKEENIQTTIKKTKRKNKELYYNQSKEEKSLIEKIKYITSDYTIIHLILFLLIASPFLMFAYYLIKASLTN